MTDYSNNTKQTSMPLEGVRVLEYAVFHAGPGAGAILGDLGAEVIKIEEGTGDPERYWTMVGGMDLTLPNGESIWFQISNRKKLENNFLRFLTLHLIHLHELYKVFHIENS